MELTKIERETIINFNEEEDIAHIYTCNKRLQNKLDELCSKRNDISREVLHDYGVVYKLPKAWVKVSPPRQLTEEQRQDLSDRAKRNLSRKKGIDEKE